jgi:hypothetical protein
MASLRRRYCHPVCRPEDSTSSCGSGEREQVERGQVLPDSRTFYSRASLVSWFGLRVLRTMRFERFAVGKGGSDGRSRDQLSPKERCRSCYKPMLIKRVPSASLPVCQPPVARQLSPLAFTILRRILRYVHGIDQLIA